MGWLSAKATPPERKGGSAKKCSNKKRYCKICGQITYIGNICGSCKQFLNDKKLKGENK